MGVCRRFCCGLTVALLATVLASCAALSPAQMKAVNNLSVASDSVAAAPSAFFNTLAYVRTERGLFYAATLTTPEIRQAELDALSQAAVDDQKLAERTDVCVDVLNSYLRALRSLCNQTRWTSIGTQTRSVTTRLDSAILRYNALEWSQPLPEDIVKLSGKLTAYFAENYMRNRQARAVRDFVRQADTLVTACTTQLIDLIKKEEVAQLLAAEQNGLQQNYLTYLKFQQDNPTVAMTSSTDSDRHYMDLTAKLTAAVQVRDKCLSGLRALARAHHKVAQELETRRPVDHLWAELIELNSLSAKLQTALNAL